MSKNTISTTTYLPSPTMGVDWTVPENRVELPFSPFLYNWVADGRGVGQKIGDTHLLAPAAPAGAIYSFEAGNALILSTTTTNQITWPGSGADTAIAAGPVVVNDYVNYNGYIFLAGTTNSPSWDGTTYNATAFNGQTGGSQAFCTIFRNRYVQGQGTSLWYAPSAGALSGVLIELSLASFIREGAIAGVAAMSALDDLNVQDYLMVITTGGDVLFFQGDFPSSANWQLVVHKKMPLTLGNEDTISCYEYAGDAYILVSNPCACITASQLLQVGYQEAEKASILSRVLPKLKRSESILVSMAFLRKRNIALVMVEETRANRDSVWSGFLPYAQPTLGYSTLFYYILCVDLFSGAISVIDAKDYVPYFPVVSNKRRGLKTCFIGHSDGNVYMLSANGTLVYAVGEWDNYAVTPTNGDVLRWPYSPLGNSDMNKVINMAYLDIAIPEISNTATSGKVELGISGTFDFTRSGTPSVFNYIVDLESSNITIQRSKSTFSGTGFYVSPSIYDGEGVIPGLEVQGISLQHTNGGPL